MRIYYFSLLILSIFISGCGSTVTESNTLAQKSDTKKIQSLSVSSEDFTKVGIKYVNNIRSKTGLNRLTINKYLTKSAQNHANYLITNDLYSHSEESSYDLFTGETPSKRALYAGYSHGGVLEDVYAGDIDQTYSLDILLANIYHRLSFLDLGVDEVGFGMQESSEYEQKRVYTYELSNQKRRSQNTKNNPSFVTFPYKNQSGVLPVVYEEIPDPLPECSVSGFPISVQFNPQKNSQISIRSFKLFNDKGVEIKDVKLLDSVNDPSSHLKDTEFVLMPLHRLKWGSRYSVEVDYIEGSYGNDKIKWNFSTQRLPTPSFTVTKKEESFSAKSGIMNYFYLPPKDCNDQFSSYRFKTSGSLKVEERLVDNNTIKIKATGSGKVTIYPDNGREFTIYFK